MSHVDIADEIVAEAKALTYVVSVSDCPGLWDGHCLELDVVSGGSGPEQALEKTLSAVAVTLQMFRQGDRDPYEAHGPAPEEYWPPELLAAYQKLKLARGPKP